MKDDDDGGGSGDGSVMVRRNGHLSEYFLVTLLHRTREMMTHMKATTKL